MIAPTDANLVCFPKDQTWTAAPSSNEKLPIRATAWFTAVSTRTPS